MVPPKTFLDQGFMNNSIVSDLSTNYMSKSVSNSNSISNNNSNNSNNHKNSTSFDSFRDNPEDGRFNLPLLLIVLGICAKLVFVLWLIKSKSFKRSKYFRTRARSRGYNQRLRDQLRHQQELLLVPIATSNGLSGGGLPQLVYPQQELLLVPVATSNGLSGGGLPQIVYPVAGNNGDSGGVGGEGVAGRSNGDLSDIGNSSSNNGNSSSNNDNSSSDNDNGSNNGTTEVVGSVFSSFDSSTFGDEEFPPLYEDALMMDDANAAVYENANAVTIQDAYARTIEGAYTVAFDDSNAVTIEDANALTNEDTNAVAMK